MKVLSKSTYVLANADTINKNGHVWPTPLLEKIVSSNSGKYIYGGPVAPPVDRPAKIDKEMISHRVKNLRLENKNLVGDVEVLDTPQGELLVNLLDANDNSGFVFAGTGTLTPVSTGPLETGYSIVNDFKLEQIYYTATPSHVL